MKKFYIITCLLFISIIFNLNIKSLAALQLKEITINYNMNFTEEYTGLGENFSYDGIPKPTVHGKDTYSLVINNGESTTLESVSENHIAPYDTETSEGTKDKSVIEFIGWKDEKTSTIIPSSKQTLTWRELQRYEENGVVNLTVM